MKVVKQDFSKNHFRVVNRFPFFPIRIWVVEYNRGKWVFLETYYELQLDSYWGKGWLKQEQSFSPHCWDYKWDDRYLTSHQMSKEEEKKVKLKYPPMYKNSFTTNDVF